MKDDILNAIKPRIPHLDDIIEEQLKYILMAEGIEPTEDNMLEAKEVYFKG